METLPVVSLSIPVGFGLLSKPGFAETVVAASPMRDVPMNKCQFILSISRENVRIICYLKLLPLVTIESDRVSALSTRGLTCS